MPMRMEGGATPQEMSSLDAVKYALGLAKPEEETRVKAYYQPSAIQARMQENLITPNNWREKFSGDAFIDMGSMAGTLSKAPKAAAATLPEVKQALGLGEQLARDASGTIPDMTKKIKAYHGSPFDFDKFDISKVGTGEGSQIRGDGLYFTDEGRGAKKYAERLGKWVDGPRGKERRGYLYEVEIDADPKQILDLDRPIWEQPEILQRLPQDARGNVAIQGMEPLQVDNLTGDALYKKIKALPNGAELLRSAGVRGLSYGDAGTKGRNYVVFDDSLIKILRKRATIDR